MTNELPEAKRRVRRAHSDAQAGDHCFRGSSCKRPWFALRPARQHWSQCCSPVALVTLEVAPAARSPRPCLLHPDDDTMDAERKTQRKLRCRVAVVRWLAATACFVASLRLLRAERFTSQVARVALVVFGVLAARRYELGCDRSSGHRDERQRHDLDRVDRRISRVRVLPRSGLRRTACGALRSRAPPRTREWEKIAFNCVCRCAVAAGGTAVFLAGRLRQSGSTAPIVLIVATALSAACTYLRAELPLLVSFPVAISCGESYFKVLRADRRRSTSERFRLRCWGWGSGGCTSSSVPRSCRCSSSRS